MPDGYTAETVPPRWTTDGDTLTFQTKAFKASGTWEITLTPDN